MPWEPALADIGVGQFLANLDGLTALYAAAMAPPAQQLPGRRAIMERHAGYKAFRAVVALLPPDAPPATGQPPGQTAASPPIARGTIPAAAPTITPGVARGTTPGGAPATPPAPAQARAAVSTTGGAAGSSSPASGGAGSGSATSGSATSGSATSGSPADRGATSGSPADRGATSGATSGSPADGPAGGLPAGSRLVGFAYGFHGENGQWWHDLVCSALAQHQGRQAARSWMSDSFEVAEVHVHPAHQGHGTGHAMLVRLVAGRPEHTAVLSTMDADTSARRLYRGVGFADLLPGFIFPGADLPYTIMGATLPLADRATLTRLPAPTDGTPETTHRRQYPRPRSRGQYPARTAADSTRDTHPRTVPGVHHRGRA